MNVLLGAISMVLADPSQKERRDVVSYCHVDIGAYCSNGLLCGCCGIDSERFGSANEIYCCTSQQECWMDCDGWDINVR
jgi:hypothetical protein